MLEIMILIVVIVGAGKEFIWLGMNLYLLGKTIRYKNNKNYLVKRILFNSFRDVELVVFDYGLTYVMKCEYKDLEIY